MPKRNKTTLKLTPKEQVGKKHRQRKPKQNGQQQRVAAPVATTRIVKTGNPNVSSSGRSVRIRHREFVQDLTAANSSFAAYLLAINPGVTSTFPWLSSQAIRYESYLFHKLHFIYEPMVSTSTNGSLMLAVDFDAADSVPANKTAMMANQSAVRTSVWNSVTYKAREANLAKFGVQRYTRGNNRPTGTDVKTYDIGNLIYAWVGSPTSQTTLGELYVEYDVELFTPQIDSSTTVANQPSQTTVLSFNNGVAQLVALITGSNSPLMWILDGTPGFMQLAMNLTGYTQWFINMRGSLSAGTITNPPWQFFGNAKPNYPGSGGTIASPFELARLADSAGGQFTAFSNSFTANYLLSGDGRVIQPGNPVAFSSNFNAWPSVFRTTNNATGVFNIGILASAAGDVPTIQAPFGDAAVDFAGFQIPIPQLQTSQTLTSRGGSLTRLQAGGPGATMNLFFTNKDDFEEYVATLHMPQVKPR